MSCNALRRRGFSAFHFSNGVRECAYPGRSPCLRWLLTPSVWGWHFALAIALLCCLAKQRPSFWAFFSSCSSSHVINLNHNLRQTWSWECCPQRDQQAVAFTVAPKPPTQMAKNRFMIFIVPSRGFLGSLQNLSDYVVIESEAWSNSGLGGPGRSELWPWVTLGFEPSLKRVLYFNWIMFLLSRSMFQ